LTAEPDNGVRTGSTSGKAPSDSLEALEATVTS
jgi:hypothetical protein